MKKFILTTALATGLLAGTSAVASTITVEKQVSTNTFGTENYKIVTSFAQTSSGETRNNVYAGAFQLKADFGSGVQDFMAFCLQPFEWLRLNTQYHLGTGLDSGTIDNLNTLAANFFGSVTDKISAAAFQMAVWEITTETEQTLNVNYGDFRITGGSTDSNAAETKANDWLTQLAGMSTPNESFLMMSADGTQDLLTNLPDPNNQTNPVPLPAAGWMLIAGVGGLAAASRRKKRTA